MDYQERMQNWQDFDSEYYTMLDAIDRLKESLEEKYGSLYKAGPALGYHKSDLVKRFTTCCVPPTIKSLVRICKGADLGLDYIVTGTGTRHCTIGEVTFNNLKKIWQEKYYGRRSPVLSTAICALNKGKLSSLPMKYLIRIAREQHVTIEWLIGG